MHVRVLTKEKDVPTSLQLTLENREEVEVFKQIMQRAMNTWVDIPKVWIQLSDKFNGMPSA